MAKANIKRPDGTSITIEGEADEVAALVHKIEGSPHRSGKPQEAARGRQKKARPSIPDLLMSLYVDGFFKQPKDLAEVKNALGEGGHIYPVTSIAPALLRLVKRRELRRLKQDKRWFYTG